MKSIINERIRAGLQQAANEGKATISLFESPEEFNAYLNEASALTGSGTGKGGKIDFTDAFSALRLANPLRIYAKQTMSAPDASDATFVARTGNAQLGAANPWGYTVQANAGSPNYDTVYWQQPIQTVTAQLPIRSAVLDDVNGLDQAIMTDIILELSQIEGSSMQVNVDTAAPAGNATGGSYGLRGLNSYPGAPALGASVPAAYGTSGTTSAAGRHTLATVANGSLTGVTYDDIVNLVNALPPQYWGLPGTCFFAAPAFISTLRKLKDTAGMPVFLEIGDEDAAAVGYMFGFPVLPSSYMVTGDDTCPIYLANWPRFLHIVDHPEVEIQKMEQTQPGFVTFFAQKRVCSTVADPFAGARLLIKAGTTFF